MTGNLTDEELYDEALGSIDDSDFFSRLDMGEGTIAPALDTDPDEKS